MTALRGVSMLVSIPVDATRSSLSRFDFSLTMPDNGYVGPGVAEPLPAKE